jgi:hypothetical protein
LILSVEGDVRVFQERGGSSQRFMNPCATRIVKFSTVGKMHEDSYPLHHSRGLPGRAGKNREEPGRAGKIGRQERRAGMSKHLKVGWD